MKNIMLILAALSASYSYADECGINEKLVATCNIPGKTKHTSSFCENKNDDTIQYTFKKDNTPELVVNFNSQKKLKRWVDLGTYSTYLGFSNGAYAYILIIPEERPGAVALLDIKKNGNLISTKRCDSNSFGEEDIKSNSIEDIPDSTVRDNGFKFP